MLFMPIAEIGSGGSGSGDACRLAARPCVISLGLGKAAYRNSLERLKQSLERVRFNGDFFYWNQQLPSGCPDHFDVPFGFKTYCFYEAYRLGYRQILWMDSTCIALRSLKPVFQSMSRNGYIFFNNNYEQVLGQWISDEALEQHRLSRDQAMGIPELPCSVLGLDLSQPLASNFLEQWHQVMADGVTARGTRAPIRDWEDYQAIFWNRNQRISADPRAKGHRCDQPAAGLVAHRLGMLPYGDQLRDIHYPRRPIRRNTAILHYREFSENITPLNAIIHQVFFRGPFIEAPRSKVRALARRLRNLMRGVNSPIGLSI